MSQDTIQHTPGPWSYNGKSFAVYAGNQQIANLTDLATGMSHPAAQHANARLIAAAPDLLKACETMLDAYDYIPIPDSEDKRSRKAYEVLAAARDQLIEAIPQP